MQIARSLWPGLLAAVLFSGVGLRADTLQFKPLPSGASSHLAWIMPQHMALTINPPSILKKSPPKLTAPRYGVLVLGTKEHPTYAIFILDEPEGKASRLYVDSNGNGDLTDDPAPEWASHTYKTKDGQTFTMWEGHATVEVHYGDKTLPLRLGLVRYAKDDPEQTDMQYTLLYYADYACEGDVTLGGRTYKALLNDLFTTGDFRGLGHPGDSGIILQIDLNGNGVYERRGEGFNTARPFNIQGTTYEISGMSASGETFTLGKSSKTVPEIPPPPDLRPGKKVPAFLAKTTGGQSVRFPSAYKGRVVLLYFWATWCGDCRAELPNVLKAYARFHSQGLEMLGISLDHPDAGTQLAAFTKENKMPWPQVYDGKAWNAEIAQLYFVTSIPTAILVDGDTGEVIAAGGDTLGKSLAPTLQKALAAKKTSTRK
jgi:peroxiredoxin